MQALTVRFPDDVYERLRRYAFRRRRSINAAVVGAVVIALTQADMTDDAAVMDTADDDT